MTQKFGYKFAFCTESSLITLTTVKKSGSSNYNFSHFFETAYVGGTTRVQSKPMFDMLYDHDWHPKFLFVVDSLSFFKDSFVL